MNLILFERCLARLVLDEDAPAQLLALGDHGAAMVLSPAEHIFAFRYAPGADDAFHAHLRKLIRDLKAGELTILVVGGDAQTFELIKTVRPLGFKRGRVQILQVDDVGELRGSPRSLTHQAWVKRLDEVGAARAGEREDLHELRDRLRAVINPKADGRENLQAFAKAMRGRRPLVTWGLSGLCVLIFLLQHVWGGSDFLPTLVRMGANGAGLVARGELQRLFASIFLHGNMQHILFNTIALVVLGSFIERLLGAPRFIVLFVFSGLLGSLVSSVASQGFSVGASGAILGILGASAVLSFRPVPGLLPELVLSQLKQNMLINLVLVGVVSLLPRVDLWAHLGGGLAGALLVFSGVLTRGLPRLAEVEPKGPAAQASPPIWLKPLAALSLLAMLGGLGLALFLGQAWRLTEAPRLIEQNLGDSGVTVEVPDLLLDQAQHNQQAVLDEYAYGAIDRDPAMVAVSVAKPDSPVPPELLETQFEIIRAARAEQSPEGARRDGQAQVREIAGLRTLEEKFIYGEGHLQLWRYSRMYSTAAITIEVLVWPQAPTAWRRVGETMLETLKAP